MKGKKYEYYKATIRKAEQILELQSLEDFINYAHANHIKQVILTEDLETQEPSFALTSKGALYICHTSGYKMLEDFQVATENNFPDADTYYKALAINCTTYTEYETAVVHNITDASVFEEMKTAGFVDGYKTFDELRKHNTSLPQMENITDMKALFEYAASKKFTGFADFLKIWQAGFTDPLEYRLAAEKGLNNARDYEIFRKGGFSVIEEYNIAKPLEITSYDELQQYLNLNMSAYAHGSFDEYLLISIISKLENNSETEFKKLYNFFLKQEDAYKRANEKGEMKLPKWYTKRMRKEQDVKDFLISSDQVKLFGTFNAERNIFETIHVKRRKVVVDGSNVAYNSNMVDRKRGVYGAELNNILIVVKKLKEEYDFEDIHVMSDAGLIHKVKDKGLLKEIKTLCKYSETPPGIPADLYLINHVKKHHCLLVTNDTFKDWKASDQWIEDNIEYYRVKFVLNGNIVMLPYMERFEK